MKGSDDNIQMTLNIAGELIKLDVPFDEQYKVREAERDVKLFCDKLKKTWPSLSDRNIIAMAAYQFARWYRQLLDVQEDLDDIARKKCSEIDDWCKTNLQ